MQITEVFRTLVCRSGWRSKSPQSVWNGNFPAANEVERDVRCRDGGRIQRGEQKERKSGRRSRLQSAARPLGPHPETLVFTAAARQCQPAPHPQNIRNRKVSFLLFLSISLHSTQHTCRATLEKNKLPSWKQYAAADSCARFLEMKCPTTYCFQAQGSNKKRLQLVLMFTQANVFWPAVLFLLLPHQNYEHSASYHRHNVWL